MSGARKLEGCIGEQTYWWARFEFKPEDCWIGVFWRA